jgi:hypothetical protein
VPRATALVSALRSHKHTSDTDHITVDRGCGNWPYVAASAVIHVAYFLLVGASYRSAGSFEHII